MAKRKKFIKRMFLFLVITTILLILLNYIYIEHVLAKKNFYGKEIQYQQFLNDLSSKEVETLFFGDSHVFHGVNPEYIPNSFNWGSGTQNYIKSYYLLNRIVEKDKIKVDTIVLQIDPHSFSEWLVSDPFLFNELELYSQFVSLKEVKKIRKDDSLISLWFESKLPVIGKGKEFGVLFFGIELSEMKLGWIKDIGDFSKFNEEEKKDHANGEYIKRFVGYEKMDNLSLEYFKEILKFAKDRNINVVLVKYPFTEEYKNMLEEKNLGDEEYYNLILNEANSVSEDYDVLDYSDLFFDNPGYFGDATHLNYIGAEKLSKNINQDLQALNLTEKDSKIEIIKLNFSEKKTDYLFWFLLPLIFLEIFLLILLLKFGKNKI